MIQELARVGHVHSLTAKENGINAIQGMRRAENKHFTVGAVVQYFPLDDIAIMDVREPVFRANQYNEDWHEKEREFE